MTLQQMEYIVAVNKYRQFVVAAKNCGVAQPSLSAMIQKLEDELGVKIFDRTKQPIEPTPIGEKIISQAEVAIRESKRIREIVDYESGNLTGPLRIGIIPTLAPYIVPDFINNFRKSNPEIELTIVEKTTAELINELHQSNVDIVIAATPLNKEEFIEIPVYYERFVAYFSNEKEAQESNLSANDMPLDNLWILKEGHCMRNQTFNFCKNNNNIYNHIYEAGSIDTLIRIVDKNGGYSLIPELHIQYLSEEQLKHLKVIDSPPAVREVSLVITKDYLKERVINAVADTIKQIIPENMLDARLKRFSIKL